MRLNSFLCIKIKDVCAHTHTHTHTHTHENMAMYHKAKWMEMFVVDTIGKELSLIRMNCYKWIRIEQRV